MLAPQAPAEPRRQPVGQPVAVAELRPLWVTKGGVIEEAPVQRHEPTSRCGPGIEGREERKLVELGLELELELHGDLTPEQRERMAEIAHRCPVHRTLVGEKEIVVRLADPT